MKYQFLATASHFIQEDKKFMEKEQEGAQKINAVANTDTPTPPTAEGTVLMYEDRPQGEPVEIFRIGNDKAVMNGGKSPTVTLQQAYYLTEITTYHWNGSKGTPAGTVAMKGSDGKTYGPWQASLINGVYWTAKPGATLAAGSYTVIDSDPSTWAQNAEDGGQGMTWASGIPVK